MYFKFYNLVASATFDNLTWFEDFIKNKYIVDYEDDPDSIVYSKDGDQWVVGVRSKKLLRDDKGHIIYDSLDVYFYIETDHPELLGTGKFKVLIKT